MEVFDVGSDSKVTLHMASSLDFFIAKDDQSVSWLETSCHYEKGISLTDEAIEAFLKTIDCYVMGSRTYETALRLGWLYGDTPAVVLTHRDLPAIRPGVEFYSGELSTLVNEHLKPRYRNIWVVGGAMVAREFIRLRLADDIRISIIPIMLGGGTLFVDYIGREQPLRLKDVTTYKNGLVELWYEIPKEQEV